MFFYFHFKYYDMNRNYNENIRIMWQSENCKPVHVEWNHLFIFLMKEFLDDAIYFDHFYILSPYKKYL